MKKILAGFLVLVSTLFTFTGCNLLGQGKALDYNNTIVNLQEAIVREVVSFTNNLSAEELDATAMQAQHEKLVKTIDDNITKLENLKALPDDKGLKQSSLDLFKFYRKTVNEDFKVMMDILTKDNSTEEDLKKVTEITEKFASDEEPIHDKFIKSQEEFAKKYGFQLQENALNKELGL